MCRLLFQNFEGTPLSVLGYHWLPLPAIDLVGGNREFKIYFRKYNYYGCLIVSKL